MGRLSISCLLPASWHFSISPVGCPRILNTTLRQIVVIGLVAAAVSVLYYSLLVIRHKYSRASRDKRFHRYLARVTDTEATDTNNPNLNYGIVVDCGSSGSRIFVYCWPRHNGNPHDLLDIKQMRDKNRKPVVMKIKPGISEFASSPEKVSDYISPLLSFAAEHVPRAKHKETPLYILCTAGMRILPESQQKAILEDLLTDIPVHFDFLFSDSHAEECMHGLASTLFLEDLNIQMMEEVAKNLLAEFNLGCDAHQTEHVYRVYVATFLGFGGNAARQRYEESLFSSTALKNRLLGKQTGMTSASPHLDPCLPLDAQDEIQQNGQTMYLRGTGDFSLCRELLQPFMNKTNETQTSLNGVYQPSVHFQNSEFYGFSEFYYCTEDVLRMGGDYNAARFAKAAKDYCATKWSVLRERFDRGLYASHADLHRLKYQCFKSAWMYEVFHSGFSFPVSYSNLKTALQVYDKEVQWTLGAILYRTRFLPLRDIQQENFHGSHSHWRSFSFVYNHYLFSACFLVVLLSILLYLLRLRRIHRRMLRNSSSPSLWIEEGLSPQKIPGPL
ncbi:ectonucleoside triphosphate diphosphohydrolase 4 isoform X3 [Colius striatus]|uniref:ectonucleoside triphosphate diphosphohydrolase 4 isoform X3 n=1 Tax=Colius striatus TaxID=57412 RepID=UPI002B1D9F32|nr:ectonucleoside triphosphate diphosphohydrolase 4 isoform X3 [Colius striatus]